MSCENDCVAVLHAIVQQTSASCRFPLLPSSIFPDSERQTLRKVVSASFAESPCSECMTDVELDEAAGDHLRSSFPKRHHKLQAELPLDIGAKRLPVRKIPSASTRQATRRESD